MFNIMPSIFLAGLSAIAAICSAGTAFFMYRFNKKQVNMVLCQDFGQIKLRFFVS